jgi:mRNA-degrading endonuclease RelE of RelBE toxin-antitoxin system
VQYDIEFKPRAIKDLKALPPRERARIVAKVEGL